MNRDYEKLYMAILALVIVVATFKFGLVLLTTTIPDENRDIINVALGMILGLSGTVVGYYFGSSKSSSDKSKALIDIDEKEKVAKEIDEQAY